MTTVDGVGELAIVVPVLDRDEELRRALHSIQVQGVAAEVFIVNDGSDPRFAAVADAAAAAVRQAGAGLEASVIHRRQSGGPSVARNAGLRAARGRWLLVLDSDDELCGGALEAVMAELSCETDNGVETAAHVGLVCCNVRMIGALGTALVRPELQAGFPGAPLSVLAGSFVVSADVATAVGGYDEQLRFGENTDFILRCAEHCRTHRRSIRSLDVVLSQYNKRSDERRSDQARYDSTVHLLARGRFDLADPVTRAKHHSIAAVNAARLGRYTQSIRHAALAVRYAPRDPRHLARLAVSCTGPLARRRWS